MNIPTLLSVLAATKRIPLLLVFLLPALSGAAQNFDFAEQVFGFLQEGRGDSICARLAPQMAAAVTPETFGRAYAGLERSLGKMNRRGDWRRDKAGTTTADYCKLYFGGTPLKLTVVTDENQRILALTLTPLPPEKSDMEGRKSDVVEAGCGTERSITVENGDVRLPGTLTLPNGADRPVPVVVFVHGSGPNDRDETLGPNRLFRSLADSLAKAGIASLRYDKRTFVYRVRPDETGGCSDYDSETVDDAVAAVRLAASLPGTDPARVFVIGHSQGAMLAPRIANRCPDAPAGIVALAAPARPLAVLLREQLAYISQSQGGTADDVEATVGKLLGGVPPAYRHFADTYDAPGEAKGTPCPMLFVQGGHDYQVTAEDFALWKAALAGHDGADFAFFPRCDHLMRELPRMAVPADYMAARPLSPAVVRRIVGFISGH